MPLGGHNFITGRDKVLARVDQVLARIHSSLIASHPLASVAGSVLVYAAVILLLGTRLEISSNYFVLLPLLVAATAWHLPGGIAAGILALPCNLLLFALIGHPEYSPASKPIAELSGIFVGTTLGYLADYFQKLGEEVERRAEVEETLRKALAEKDFLLNEVHHRVRNNLTVIKSLIQLQKSRSADKLYVEAMDALLARVFAIASAHDQLLAPGDLPEIDLRSYLSSLAASIAKGGPVGLGAQPRIEESYTGGPLLVVPEFATPIGLFLNEVMQNALRHAWAGQEDPRLRISLSGGGDARTFRLLVEDNGKGLPSPLEEKLGIRMMRALASQVDGEVGLGASLAYDGRGTSVELLFRLPLMPRP